MKELEEIPAYLPNGAALKDAVQKAKDWLQEVEALQVREGRESDPSVVPRATPHPVYAQGLCCGSDQSGTLVTSAMEQLHSLL